MRNRFFIRTSSVIFYYTFNLLKILLKNLLFLFRGHRSANFSPAKRLALAADEKLYRHLTTPVIKIYFFMIPMAKQVAQIIQDYLEQAALERRYSEHSLRAYRHDLKEFQDYLAEQGVRDLEAIDALLLRGFLSSLLKKNRKATVGRKVAALRACFNFALRKGWILENPAALLRAPKLEKQLPPFLSEGETDRLLIPPLEETWLIKRDQAIFELFYASGMRLSELAGLNWPNIDFSIRMVRVLGKGGRERIVPLGRVAVKALREYQAGR